MPAAITSRDLSDLLLASQATSEFKEAVKELAQGEPQNLITANAGAPSVKVLRFTMKLLEERPDLPLESLKVQASSGCSNFIGSAVAQPGSVCIEFNWDCAWRAREQGWVDHFGDPDQIRAARTLGYQCFEKFAIK